MSSQASEPESIEGEEKMYQKQFSTRRTIVELIVQHVIEKRTPEELLEGLRTYSTEDVNASLNMLWVVFEPPKRSNNGCIVVSKTCEQDQQYMSAFQLAVYRQCYPLVKCLLTNYQPDLELECTLVMDHQPIGGVSALWIAVTLNHMEMVNLLLDHGAEINHKTSTCSSPLRVACYEGNIDLVRLLINNGADVNLANRFQNTCLMLASYNGFNQIVQLLIDAHADTDQQSLCGATALHLAASQGHIDIVHLLMNNGAKFITNNEGFTPLLSAAEASSDRVVMELISIPNLVSYMDCITACELLGASYVITLDRMDSAFLSNSYLWFERAFKLRYAGEQKEPLDLTNLPEVSDPEVEPIISKPDNKPLADYSYHCECKTLAELQTIKQQSIPMLFECFVILERILGSKNITLAETLILRGAESADIGDFAMACQLWIRAIRIKLNARVFIGDDCLRFIRVLERMIQERTPYIEYMKQLLSLGTEYYTIRPRLFGYRKMCFMRNVSGFDAFETFTYNLDSKRHGLDANTPHLGNSNMDFCSKADADFDSDQVLLSMLYLCTIIAKNLIWYPIEPRIVLSKLVHKLCKLNPAQSITGRNLLHLALSIEPDVELHFNHRFNNMFTRYPSMITANFLILCGVDVTAVDVVYNTPLHFLSSMGTRDIEARIDDQCALVKMLANTRMSSADLQYVNTCSSKTTLSNSSLSKEISSSALEEFAKCPTAYANEYSVHIDAVNIFGQTASLLSANPIIDVVLSSIKDVHSLKCFAARAVHRKYLKCPGCIDNTNRFDLKELHWEHPYPHNRHVKLLRYNEYVVEVGRRHTCYERSNPYFNYRLHNPKEYHTFHCWKVMTAFAKKLSISLELAQFIEMHGPCKFLHFPCDFFSNKCKDSVNVDNMSSIKLSDTLSQSTT